MKEFRRNNPMNLRYSERNNWEGQTGQTNGFCCFKSVEYGFRAAFITLQSYGKNGYNTIRKIVTRWAPPSENPTQTYIKYVAVKMARLGYAEDHMNMRDVRLDLSNPEIVIDIMMLMTGFESGMYVQAKEIKNMLRPFGLVCCDDEPTGCVSVK